MGGVVPIILLALFFAVVGLLVEGLRWALVIAVVLAFLAAVSGSRSGAATRGRRSPGR